MGDRRYLVALVFFATFVLILALLGLVFDKSITGHQILGGNEETIPNTMTLRNDDVTNMANYPVQFGRAFVQGEIPLGFFPQVSIDGVSVQTQVDVKNRHVDGSLKYAIVSFILSSLNSGQTKTITFANIDSGTYQSTVGNNILPTVEMLNNYNFDAVVELVNPAGTYSLSARTMLQNNDIHETWLSGPVVTSVILADHSVDRIYDTGWKQQGTKVIGGNVVASATNFNLEDASWITVGQTLNWNEELVLVTNVNTGVTPHSITVIRGQGGFPAKNVEIVGPGTDSKFITSVNWQALTTSASDKKYKSFRPIFEVDFWHISSTEKKVKIRFIGENSNTEGLQDVYYDLNLKTGVYSPSSVPPVVYSQTGITHHVGARWAREFWMENSPSKKLTIDHNKNYLAQTMFVDNYDSRIQPSPTAVNNWYSCYTTGNLCYEAGVNHYSQDTCGIFKKCIFTNPSQDPGGSRFELSRIPKTDALWLNNMDWRMQEVVLAVADRGSSWPVHFREGDATKVFNRNPTTGVVYSSSDSLAVLGIGKPVTSNGRPTLALRALYWDGTSVQDKVDLVSRNTHGRANLEQPLLYEEGWFNKDLGHYYNLYSTSYLLTGRHYDYEEMLFWSAYTTVFNSDARSPNNLGYPNGMALFSTSVMREQFRPMYVRAIAATFAVDGTPEKEHFTNAVTDAIVSWMGMQNIPLANEPSIIANPWNNMLWTFGRTYWGNFGPNADVSQTPSPLKNWFGTKGNCNTNPVFPLSDPNAPRHCVSPWMMSMGVEAFGYAKDLGYPFGSLLNHLSEYYSWHFNNPTGFDYRFLGSVRQAVTNPNGILLMTPQEVQSYYIPTYISNPCVQSGYPSFCGTMTDGDNYFSQHYAATTRLNSYDSAPYNIMFPQMTENIINPNSVYHKDPRFALAPRLLSTISCVPNQQSTCGTFLAGVCSSGQRACNSAGNGYSSCVANILPGTQTEICGDGLDNDCDGSTDECIPNAPTGLTANAV